MADDEGTRKIFISYRAKEHRELLPGIIGILRAEGFDVHFDSEFLPASGLDPDSTALAPKFSGVSTVTTLGLLSCDAALVLMGSSEIDATGESLTRWQDWLDHLGLALEDGAARGGGGVPLRTVVGDGVWLWYLAAYDYDIKKRIDETWQQWEVRMCEFLGVQLIPVPVSEPVEVMDRVRALVPSLKAVPKGRQKPVPNAAGMTMIITGRVLLAGIETSWRAAENVREVGRAIRRGLFGD